MRNTGNNLETSMRPKFLCPFSQRQGSRARADLSLPSLSLPESIGAGFSLGLCQPKIPLQDPGQGIVPSVKIFQAHMEYLTMAMCWGGVVTALEVAHQL